MTFNLFSMVVPMLLLVSHPVSAQLYGYDLYFQGVIPTDGTRNQQIPQSDLMQGANALRFANGKSKADQIEVKTGASFEECKAMCNKLPQCEGLYYWKGNLAGWKCAALKNIDKSQKLEAIESYSYLRVELPSSTTTTTSSSSSSQTATSLTTTLTSVTTKTTTVYNSDFVCITSQPTNSQALLYTLSDCEQQVAMLNSVLRSCPFLSHTTLRCNTTGGFVYSDDCSTLASNLASALSSFLLDSAFKTSLSCDGDILISDSALCEEESKHVNNMTENFVTGGFKNCTFTTTTTVSTSTTTSTSRSSVTFTSSTTSSSFSQTSISTTISTSITSSSNSVTSETSATSTPEYYIYNFTLLYQSDGITTGLRFSSAKSSDARMFIFEENIDLCRCSCAANDACLGYFVWKTQNVTRCSGLNNLEISTTGNIPFKLSNQESFSYLKVRQPVEQSVPPEDCNQYRDILDPCSLDFLRTETASDLSCVTWFETRNASSADNQESLWCECFSRYSLNVPSFLSCELPMTYPESNATIKALDGLDICRALETSTSSTRKNTFELPFGTLKLNLTLDVSRQTWFNLTEEIFKFDQSSSVPSRLSIVRFSNLPKGIVPSQEYLGQLEGRAEVSGIFEVTIEVYSGQGEATQAQIVMFIKDCDVESCGGENHVCIDEEEYDGLYECNCVRNCPVVESTTPIAESVPVELQSDMLIIICVIIFLFLLVVVACIAKQYVVRRRRRSLIMMAHEKSMAINEMFVLETPNPADLEIPSDHVWLGDVLNSGFFGQLREGSQILNKEGFEASRINEVDTNQLRLDLIDIFRRSVVSPDPNTYGDIGDVAGKSDIARALQESNIIASIRETENLDESFSVEAILSDDLDGSLDGNNVTEMITVEDFIGLVFNALSQARLGRRKSRSPSGMTKPVLIKLLDVASIMNAVETNPDLQAPNDLEELVEQEFLKQVGVFESFDHVNVAKIVAVVTRSDPCLILFESSLNGDLLSYLKNAADAEANSQEYLTVRQQIQFCMDVTQGLWYIAGKRYVHQNLMAANIVVSEGLKLKIADLSMDPKRLSDCFPLFHQLGADAQEDHILRWMAPESFNKSELSPSSDIWSLAVVFYEIFSFGKVHLIDFLKNYSL